MYSKDLDPWERENKIDDKVPPSLSFESKYLEI
jgi:hypothetical protein